MVSLCNRISQGHDFDGIIADGKTGVDANNEQKTWNSIDPIQDAFLYFIAHLISLSYYRLKGNMSGMRFDHRWYNSKDRLFKHGLTMLEILVVFVIFMILASLLLGGINRARKKAHQAKCISNLKNMGEAIHTYSIDYAEKLPTTGSGAGGKESLALLNTLGYVHNEGMYICPQGNGTSVEDSDYRYAPWFSENTTADSPLACDDDLHHVKPNRVNVLYVRGHVKMEATLPSGTSAPIE